MKILGIIGGGPFFSGVFGFGGVEIAHITELVAFAFFEEVDEGEVVFEAVFDGYFAIFAVAFDPYSCWFSLEQPTNEAVFLGLVCRNCAFELHEVFLGLLKEGVVLLL